MEIDVGTVIAGKYELIRLLGKGAMGEVWLAKHDSLGGEFAIKLVEPADDIEAETAAGRFQLEAQIAAKLSRKTRHIVSVSDHGEEAGLAYLVMELLEGESLEARLKRGEPLELPETAAIVMQVARALSLAHDEGIFHRDLKPANVFLTKDEDGRLLVKLLDFGIARAMKPFKTRSPFATSKDMVLGTPSYMSPEQARGLDTLDHRCDLWALATCAYEALAHRIPFEGETVEDVFLSICTFKVVPLRHVRPDLPPAVADFFTKAFSPKLEDRFARAQELSAAFEALVDPASLEPYLGSGASSSRRLVTARASSPVIVAKTQKMANAPATPAEAMSPVRISSSLDPMPAAIDTAAGVPKKKSTLLVASGALAVAIILLGIFTLRQISVTKQASAAENTAATAAAAGPARDVPPPDAVTAPAALPIATVASSPVPTAEPRAVTGTTTAPKKESTTKAGVRATSRTSVGAHAATPTASPATTSSPAPAPHPTQKKVDKGEVF